MRIYVIECGWILVGAETERRDYGRVSLTDASVVRKWNNGRGIGALAKKDFKDEYTLDSIGDVDIAVQKIIFEIPCEW